MKPTATLLLALLTAAPATAQQAELTEGGTLTVSWTPPTDVNAAACDTATAIDITLTNPTPVIAQDDTLYVWWNNSGDCSAIVTDTASSSLVASISIPGTAPPLIGGAFNFPADAVDPSGNKLTFTYVDLLNHLNACTAKGIALTTTHLCFAIDLPDLNDSRNGQADLGEPNAWVELSVDTKPPPAPDVPKVTGLDNKLKVTAEVTAAGDNQDIAKWRVVIRPEPTLEADRATPCSGWTDADGMRSTVEATAGQGPVDISVGANNGQAYELCVHAIDAFGNESPASGLAFGQPEPSCGFVECYPGELETGYCGATSYSEYLSLGSLLLLFHRRRRAKEIKEPRS